MTELNTIKLVEPDLDRDPPISLSWLQGDVGKKTLELMGNNPDDITEPTLEAEIQRVQEFIDNDNQLNWMIESDGEIVGSVWVDLEDTEHLKAPSVHIMIGETEARGKGVGTQSIMLAIEKLKD